MSTPEERRQRYLLDLLDAVMLAPLCHFAFCRGVADCNCGVAYLHTLAYRAKHMWQDARFDTEEERDNLHRLEDEMKAAHGLRWTEFGYVPKEAGDHVRDRG